MSRVLKPPSEVRYGLHEEHFGCPVCGTVWTLPVAPGEAPPYCASHSGTYSWRPARDGSWTQCVRVKVVVE